MTNLFDIKGNVTVITGGTGVLGRAIARYLALNGAYVIILGRKESTGAEIVADTREAIAAEKASGSIEFLKTDVMERTCRHTAQCSRRQYARSGNKPRQDFFRS